MHQAEDAVANGSGAEALAQLVETDFPIDGIPNLRFRFSEYDLRDGAFAPRRPQGDLLVAAMPHIPFANDGAHRPNAIAFILASV